MSLQDIIVHSQWEVLSIIILICLVDKITEVLRSRKIESHCLMMMMIDHAQSAKIYVYHTFWRGDNAVFCGYTKYLITSELIDAKRGQMTQLGGIFIQCNITMECITLETNDHTTAKHIIRLYTKPTIYNQ